MRSPLNPDIYGFEFKYAAVKKDDKDHEEQGGMEDEKKQPLLPMKQKDNGKEKGMVKLPYVSNTLWDSM